MSLQATLAAPADTEFNRTRRKAPRFPYLDGLRAYSILVVILSHSLERFDWLGPCAFLRPLIADGQLGVRVFFVISGFLITSLLLEELETTRCISIRGFYERRIARIFPVFYLYIGLVLLLTVLHITTIPPGFFCASATFSWNFIHFWNHASRTADAALLGHFWTLSLEEQFYLFWPGCLVLLGQKRSYYVALFGVVGLPVLRFVTFFFIHNQTLQDAVTGRFVQDLIFIGVLAAYGARRGWIEKLATSHGKSLVPCLAAVTLFALCPLLTTMTRLGFSAYVVPTLQGCSTVALIFWFLSGREGLLRRVLETRPVVQIGLLSYSLYIWQQSILLWDRTAWIRFPFNVLAPLPIAAASYYLWEQPMRRRIRAWFHQPAQPQPAQPRTVQPRTVQPSI